MLLTIPDLNTHGGQWQHPIGTLIRVRDTTDFTHFSHIMNPVHDLDENIVPPNWPVLEAVAPR